MKSKSKNVIRLADKLKIEAECGACHGTTFKFLIDNNDLRKITTLIIHCTSCGEEETILPDDKITQKS